MTAQDFNDDVTKCRALWRRGRQVYATLFQELKRIEENFGDPEKYAAWCFFELRISLSILNNVAGILKKADADRIRHEQRLALEAERAKRRQERAADEQRLAPRREEARKEKERKEEERREQQRKKAAKRGPSGSDNRRARIARYAVDGLKTTIANGDLTETRADIILLEAKDDSGLQQVLLDRFLAKKAKAKTSKPAPAPRRRTPRPSVGVNARIIADWTQRTGKAT